MQRKFENLESQFGFKEYIYNYKIEGFVFNVTHIIHTDEKSYSKIYFVTKDLQNFFIKVPYYFTFLIKCENISDTEEYIKQKYFKGYFKSEIVEKYSFKQSTCWNSSKTSFLKVFIKNKTIFNEIIIDFKKIVNTNLIEKDSSKIYNIMSKEEVKYTDIRSQILNIYEYDLPDEINLLVTLKIKVGKWYSFSYNGENYKIQEENDMNIPNLRIFVFSIRTTKNNILGACPKSDQITDLSIITESGNYFISNESFEIQNPDSFISCSIYNEKYYFKIFNMKNEEELLLKFVELIYEYKPHIMATYDGSLYEFIFLEKRFSLYGLNLNDLLGIYLRQKYFESQFSVQIDCNKWISQNKELIESKNIENTNLCLYIKDFENSLDSISSVVSLHKLFSEHVLLSIYAMCSKVSYSPTSLICKSSCDLYESLLIEKSLQENVVIPNKRKVLSKHKYELYKELKKRKESFKIGIFREDFTYKFNIDEQFISYIVNWYDDILAEFKNEKNFYEVKKDFYEKIENLKEVNDSTAQLLFLGIEDLFVNLILSNRIQPFSIILKKNCAKCKILPEDQTCKKSFKFNENEFRNISPDFDKKVSDTSFSQKRFNENAKLSDKEKNSVCQNDNSFFGSNIKKILVQKFEYEHLSEELSEKYNNNIKDKDRELYKKQIDRFSSLSKSLRFLIDACIENIFNKESRWYSDDVCELMCSLWSQMIREITNSISNISNLITFDKKGIWTLFPITFPLIIKFESGRVVNFVEMYLNYKMSQVFSLNLLDVKFNSKTIKMNYRKCKGIFVPASGKEDKSTEFYISDNIVQESKLENFILRFKKEILINLLNSFTLQNCYDEMSKTYEKWSKFILTKGKNFNDIELVLILSEKYFVENEKTGKIKKMTEKFYQITGKDFTKNIYENKKSIKYLKIKYPKKEAEVLRVVPAEICNLEKYLYELMKWCNLDKINSLHELIDWNYYKRKLDNLVTNWICLPSISQSCKNSLPESLTRKCLSRMPAEYVKLDFKKTLISSQNDKLIKNNKEFNKTDKYKEYYDKLQDQKGLIKATVVEDEIELVFYNQEVSRQNYFNQIYILADPMFYIKHDVTKVDKFLPFSKDKVCLGQINSSVLQDDILSNKNIKAVYHTNIPVLFENQFGKIKISKYPDFCLFTSFNYDKHLIYVFTKNGKTVYISKLKNENIKNIEISTFLKNNVQDVVVLNKFDKNLKQLTKLCRNYIILYETVQIPRILCSFEKLLDLHRSSHFELNKKMSLLLSLSDYSNIPIGNISLKPQSDIFEYSVEDILDYLYYLEVKRNNGLCADREFSPLKSYSIEKINPGFYESYAVQFCCPGSLVLAILEYKNLFSESINFSEFYRFDFLMLQNLLRKLMVDFNKGIKCTEYMLLEFETWIYKSRFFTSDFKNLINLIHQRFIYNLVGIFEKLEIPLIYVSGNIFCINTNLLSINRVELYVENIRLQINKINGYTFADFKILRIFEKLLLFDPNIYFYKKENEFYCISDIKLPSEFIKTYFANLDISADYIYNLITSINANKSKLILKSLEFRGCMSDIVDSSRKLLKINEFEKEVCELEILITCGKCKNENVLRSRCIKCLSRYTKDEVDNSLIRYFNYFLKLELKNDLFCTKCHVCSEKKFVEYCCCGGLFKKKNYSEQLFVILSKFKNIDLLQKKQELLKFYKIYKEGLGLEQTRIKKKIS